MDSLEEKTEGQGLNVQVPEGLQKFITVDLSAVEQNAKEILSHLPQECKLLAVVKADAYGLGAVAVAQALEPHVAMFGVTTLEEAIELRQAGIKKDILVFGPVTSGQAGLFEKYSLTATVDSAASLAALAESSGKLAFHLKVNTGMNRLGVNVEDVPTLLRIAAEQNSVELKGIYSHLFNAADSQSSKIQIEAFQKVLSCLKEQGIEYGLAHLANSTAIVRLPESYFDLVRAGTILYGQSAVPLPQQWQLQDPFCCVCRIVSVRTVEKGQAIGYGPDFMAKSRMELGVIPIGYADGFLCEPNSRPLRFSKVMNQAARDTARLMSHQGVPVVRSNDRVLPLVGRVSMQLASIDISGTGLKLGDEVTVTIRRTAANPNITRIYLREGKQAAIRQRGQLFFTQKQE